LSCGFFFLSFFPQLFSAVADWMSTILPHDNFHTWCGLSANLGCRSETCCTRLTENTGRKNRQKFATCAPSYNFIGLYFATKACIDNRKKNLLNSNISQTRPHNMVNFGPLAAEIGALVWGTSRFQRVSRRSTEANQTLRDVWPSADFYIEANCPS